MKFSIALILCLGIFSIDAFPKAHESKESVIDKLSFISTFVDAVQSGNVDDLKKLIQDYDVNLPGEHERTALHYAAEYGNEKVLDVLIEDGANINLEDDEGLTAIHFAALNENEKVMDTLIKHGATVNKSDKTGNTPLHLAALNSNEKVMELLLNNGADITPLNNEEETALHWASVNKNENVTDMLIKKGIDIHQMNDDKNTALHLSALNSNEKIADLLIKSGANVNAIGDDGWTPLYYAIINGNEQFKKYLVDRDDDETYAKKMAAKCVGRHWSSPVQEHANEKIAELLINNGANVNQEDTDDGMRPYDEAVVLGDEKMKALLVKHGAKTDKH